MTLVFAFVLAAQLDSAPHERVEKLVAEMSVAESAMVDSSMVMHKRERVAGTLQAAETMRVRFRKPHHIYSEWIEGSSKGRIVVWKRAWNQGRLRVRDGWLTLDLDPAGWLAMRGQRHNITELGFSFTVQLIVDDTLRAKRHPKNATFYQWLGERDVHGVSATCWRSELPRNEDPAFYGDAAEVCVGSKTRMPLLVKIWHREQGKLVLVEDYSYSEVKLNTGLKDSDLQLP